MNEIAKFRNDVIRLRHLINKAGKLKSGPAVYALLEKIWFSKFPEAASVAALAAQLRVQLHQRARMCNSGSTNKPFEVPIRYDAPAFRKEDLTKIVQEINDAAGDGVEIKIMNPEQGDHE